MNNVENMNQGSPKPRMLYLAQDYRGVLVPNNMEPIVYRIENWLSHFFDVVRVGTHCSLAREIETHKPDLILFDGFIEGCQRKVFTISDLYTHPEIPRAGLCRVDSLSPSRYALFEYFNMVGAQSVFVLGDMTMSESCPDFVDKIYYIPQFIDASVYRDYGMFKSIPVLLVGNFDHQQYPWRKAVRQDLLDRFPTCYFRHPGYMPDGINKNPVVIYGSEFAKTVNSSLVVPTSGGFKNIAVSKHVEVPAARACLVSDSTPSVVSYGFESMKNCVLADAKDAPDAIDYLLRHRDELEHITQAGFEMVHARHTIAQRDQLLCWTKLAKVRTVNQKIVQPDHFGPLQLVEVNSPVETLHLRGGLDLELVAKGDEFLWAGNFDEAQKQYDSALALCDYMAEPHLRNGILKLLTGKPEAAWMDIWHNIAWVVDQGALRGDPVDVAYGLIALLCTEKFSEAVGYAKAYSRVRRIELDRARWSVFAALGHEEAIFDLQLVEESAEPRTPSMYALPRFSFEEQIKLWVQMLAANKQETLARNLQRFMNHEIQLRAEKRKPLELLVSTS